MNAMFLYLSKHMHIYHIKYMYMPWSSQSRTRLAHGCVKTLPWIRGHSYDSVRHFILNPSFDGKMHQTLYLMSLCHRAMFTPGLFGWGNLSYMSHTATNKTGSGSLTTLVRWVIYLKCSHFPFFLQIGGHRKNLRQWKRCRLLERLTLGSQKHRICVPSPSIVLRNTDLCLPATVNQSFVGTQITIDCEWSYMSWFNPFRNIEYFDVEFSMKLYAKE